MNKVKVAILGSGNIGTDLMLKLRRSKVLELTAMIGIDPDSDGLRHARKYGYETISNGIEGMLEQPELADIVFDATSAKAHFAHAPLLEQMGKRVIDLTPAAIGPFVVPAVNMTEHLDCKNINMITCGGQATIPIVHAIQTCGPLAYAEIVATIASKSAGIGTRENIDEFTVTTSKGIETIGKAKKGKAIILLNPAEPPIMMRNTIYALLEEVPNGEQHIRESIASTVATIQSYVPGYRLRGEPLFDGKKITVFIEVEGSGDYLPVYAGNLDIMTASAVKVAEELALGQLQMAMPTSKGEEA